MKIFATRTKMAGMKNLAYSYDVYVPLSDVPHKAEVSYMTILDDPNGNKIKAVSLAEATRPAKQRKMSRGFDKLDAWNAHEKQTNEVAWYMVQQIFPETLKSGLDTMPTLWVLYDNAPDLDHDRRWIKA